MRERTMIYMGDIGENPEEWELIPEPITEPVKEPSPIITPAPVKEPVPA